MQPLPAASFPAFPATPAPYPVDLAYASAPLTSQNVLLQHQPFNTTYFVPAATTATASDATISASAATATYHAPAAPAAGDHCDPCNAPYDANTERWRTFAIVASCFEAGLAGLSVASMLPNLLSGGAFGVLYNTAVFLLSVLALHGCAKRRWRHIAPAAIVWGIITAFSLLTCVVGLFFTAFSASCAGDVTDNGCNALRYGVIFVLAATLLVTCTFVPAVYSQAKYITALRATECPAGNFAPMVPMTAIAAAPHNLA